MENGMPNGKKTFRLSREFMITGTGVIFMAAQDRQG
jgi:hypothetical protein